MGQRGATGKDLAFYSEEGVVEDLEQSPDMFLPGFQKDPSGYHVE